MAKNTVTIELIAYEQLKAIAFDEAERCATAKALLEANLKSDSVDLVFLGKDLEEHLDYRSGIYTTNEIVKNFSEKYYIVHNCNILQLLWHKYITKKI